jgi:hypothetical protein
MFDVRVLLFLAFALDGCSSTWTLGPGAWATTPPIIPGFHAVQLADGRFFEQPDTPPAPTTTPEQTVLGALQEAQATREAIRKLAR